MKVGCSKTEYMCVKESDPSRTVRLQGAEIKKVEDFKYLGSTHQSKGERGKEGKCVQAVMCGKKSNKSISKVSVNVKGNKTVVRTGDRAGGSRIQNVKVCFGNDEDV